MSSPENDEKAVRRTSISNLANFFEEALTGSNENKPIKRRSIDGKSSIVTTTDTEIVLELQEEVICATFEKQVGRTHDFKFYYGRNSRGITGLFIRNVQPQSPLAGIIEPQDQLLKVNDEDVKISEDDYVNHILDNIAGTVRLEVVRFKRHEENAVQGRESSGRNQVDEEYRRRY